MQEFDWRVAWAILRGVIVLVVALALIRVAVKWPVGRAVLRGVIAWVLTVTVVGNGMEVVFAEVMDNPECSGVSELVWIIVWIGGFIVGMLEAQASFKKSSERQNGRK